MANKLNVNVLLLLVYLAHRRTHIAREQKDGRKTHCRTSGFKKWQEHKGSKVCVSAAGQFRLSGETTEVGMKVCF